MKKSILSLILISSLFGSFGLFGQDARFSQFYNTPLNVNPALAGNGIEHIRVTALYRTQWAGMGTPFTTQGFAVDKVVNKVGVGAMITRNAAGDGAIRTLTISGNLAYHIHLGEEKNNTVSLGAQVGVINKSFDESKLTFDNQYNPDLGYDPSLSSNEIFTSTSITRPDVNIGLMWQRGWNNKNIKFRPFAGFGIFHLTRPPDSFIDGDNRQPVRKSIYGGAGYMVNDKLEVKPSVMYLEQGLFQETNFGAMVSYNLDGRNTIQAGVYNRMNDAVIAYAGYQINRLFVGMSYDVNTGELSKSGKGTNAFEISLAWSPLPKLKKEPKKREEKPEKKEQKSSREPVTEAAPVALKEISVQQPEMQLAEKVQEEKRKEEPSVKPETQNTTADNAQKVIKTRDAAPATPHKPEVKSQQEMPVSLPVVIRPDNTVPRPIDSDNDGLLDADDECPFIAGSASTKGCPDSDNDGLIDMQDDCPMESGPATNRGCPDPNVPSQPASQELVKNYNNILFETGKTRITTDDLYDIVERAIDLMYADKSTVAVLSGHTDNEGDEQMNMVLSQARAEVVKAYMIKQGIPENRIKTIAYGETMPVANNLFDNGRKENRRVEINIVRQK